MSVLFPDDVRRFIKDSIDSVEQLEVLLLLQRDPQHVWTADAVGQSLYTSAQAAQFRLAGLRACGLLACQGSPPLYRYQPASPEQEALVARLATLYRDCPVTVIGLIYARPRQPASGVGEAPRGRKKGKGK